jgi:hypothetical protein
LALLLLLLLSLMQGELEWLQAMLNTLLVSARAALERESLGCSKQMDVPRSCAHYSTAAAAAVTHV